MKYVIYFLISLLIVWSVWYVFRSVRKQLRGDCGCGRGSDCAGCGGCSNRRDEEKRTP